MKGRKCWRGKGEESEILVGHASRHASFAGNRDRPLEPKRTIGRTWTILFHLFAPSVHLPRRVSLFPSPSKCPRLSLLRGARVHGLVVAASHQSSLWGRLQALSGPAEKGLLPICLGGEIKRFFSLFLPLSLSVSRLVNRLGERWGWNEGETRWWTLWRIMRKIWKGGGEWIGIRSSRM